MLANRPPMGWNSWNTFGENIDEKLIMETADIISTFTYRRGLLDADYGFSTAVGMFNSLVNFVILFGANKLSRRLTGESLW